MGDTQKTKKQLLEELDLMRDKLAEMESQGPVAGNREEKERYFIQDIRLLSSAAMALVELAPEENIYELIGIHLQQLAGDSVTVVNSFDRDSRSLRVEAMIGLGEHHKTILKMLGSHPV
ncbi:MAG: hypothetical protein JRJ51_07800, partial [Deltaproteobacteria bacterium]|nr:hypothetical protein [Deltaproteobacteria bacterium]